MKISIQAHTLRPSSKFSAELPLTSTTVAGFIINVLILASRDEFDQLIKQLSQDLSNCLVSPSELAAFLHTKQNYRIWFDQKYIDHVHERRRLGPAAELGASGSAAA